MTNPFDCFAAAAALQAQQMQANAEAQAQYNAWASAQMHDPQRDQNSDGVAHEAKRGLVIDGTARRVTATEIARL